MLGKRKRGTSKAGNAFRRVKPVEEVTFDFGAREDYLTGFHKRKVQRKKHAQEEAAKQEREDKILQRKELRESRQKELEEHVKAVKDAVRKAEGLEPDSGDEPSDGTDNDEWHGFDEAETTVVNHEDEYSDSDQDQEATVTVEAVDVDRDGMHTLASDSDEDDAAEQEKARQPVSKDPESSASGKKIWTKEKPKVPKTKKKKFRYESKADRKLNRVKEKASKARKRSKREAEE